MIKKLFASQLRINMVSGMLCTGINAAAMIIAYPLYLHCLGLEKYGVWLVLTTVLSFAQLGNLGTSRAVMKLVAEEHGRNNIEGIQKTVMTTISMLLISGSIILFIILFFNDQIIGLFKLSDENTKMALWLLPYVGILCVYIFIVQVFSSALSGLGRMDLASYAQAISRIIAVGISILMLYKGYGVKSLLIGNSASYVFIHIMSLICIKRIILLRFMRISNICLIYGKNTLSFSGQLFGGSLAAMLLVPFNKLILSRYVGVASVPIFEIAFNSSMQIRGLVETSLRATMPEISRASVDTTKKGLDRIRSISNKSVKLILMFGLPIYIFIILCSPLLLKLWLKDKYTDSLCIAFRIMLVGTYFSLMGVPAFYTLVGFGKGREILIFNIIQSGVNAVMVLTVVAIGFSINVKTVCVIVMIAMTVSMLYLVAKQKTMLQDRDR